MEIWAATGSMRYEEGPNGENIFRIKVGVTVSMGDQTGTINLAAPENSNQLLELCRQKISEEVYSALEKSRELEADVFGFGETISRYAPKRWKQIKDNWDEEYQQANVELTVEIRGSGTGRIIRPLDNILD
ncbi:hypothetical protein SDC9_178298 [bioreactor metagenome]|uniref:Spore germination GerAC-like C-terminal domain-containing protein n=1 Tax=bioreactor metagenome TaxID=1076179 RepID=A0A645GVY6_9ZZZZ